jgi:hypothetical protein
MIKKISKDKNKVCSRGHNDCTGRRFGGWRIFWGLFFIAAAAAVTFSILDIYTFNGFNIGWVVLGIFLVALAINCLFKLNWFGFFLPIAGLATIANYQTGYLAISDQTIGAIWIVAGLLAIGFTILFHRHHSWHKNFGIGRSAKNYEKIIDAEDEDDVFVKVNMGSTIKYINTDNFRRAVLKANFGAITAYFDGAKIRGDKAEIVIDGSLAGFELFIPKQWNVVDNIKRNAAGVEIKNHPANDTKGKKTVVLSGKIDLSGVEITYV